jgi:hypothetical protein
MIEAALYILIGVALYGGTRQLRLAAQRSVGHPHVLHGVMYFLLAAYALAAVLSYQTPAFATLLALGKLSVAFGILLWMALSWFIAAYTASQARLTLGMLSAAWAVLLIINIGAPFSLLYSDITPISQALPSGQTRVTWQTSFSAWWTVAELLMLATLTYAAHASYRLFRGAEGRAAVALACGLLVLAVTVIADSLKFLELLQSAYLAPFGFLVLLLACSLYPALPGSRRSSLPAQRAPGYSLTLNLHPPAEQPQIQLSSATLQRAPALQPAQAGRPGPALERLPASAGFAPRLDLRSDVLAARRQVTPETREQSPAEPPLPAAAAGPREFPAEAADGAVDEAMISLISDNLIDIAVNAALLSKRCRAGGVEPSTVEELCDRIRSRASATRRIANQLRRPCRAPGGCEGRDRRG